MDMSHTKVSNAESLQQRKESVNQQETEASIEIFRVTVRVTLTYFPCRTFLFHGIGSIPHGLKARFLLHCQFGFRNEKGKKSSVHSCTLETHFDVCRSIHPSRKQVDAQEASGGEQSNKSASKHSTHTFTSISCTFFLPSIFLYAPVGPTFLLQMVHGKLFVLDLLGEIKLAESIRVERQCRTTDINDVQSDGEEH